MSNSLAIGAVTATLQQLLGAVAKPLPLDPLSDPDLADATCTVRPPDQARTKEDANQLNLFLYQMAPNAAYRNAWMPGAQDNDLSQAPLALDLYYLLTAYGRNFDEVLSHRLLGRAMSILHDATVLYPEDIQKALPGSDLAMQVERVHITPRTMTSDELSKLWTTFQTPYRISTSYEVRVVVIDSSRHSRVAPPIVLRGPAGTGNDAVGGLLPAIPELLEVILPTPGQPAARLGEQITVAGHDLGGTGLTATLTHRLGATVTLGPPVLTDASATGFTLELPDAPGTLPAGVYSLAAVVTSATAPPRTTNALPLALAPRIVAVAPVAFDAAGNPSITVTISPPVWAEQRVSLVVGDLEYIARALPPSPPTVSSVTFRVTGRGPGTYRLRVRVDGVDSFLVRYDADPLALDDDPLLTVTLP